MDSVVSGSEEVNARHLRAFIERIEPSASPDVARNPHRSGASAALKRTLSGAALRRRLSYGVLVLAWLLAIPAMAYLLAWASERGPSPPEIHYAPEEDLEAVDVALLNSAGESVDIAAYVLTDVPVIQALTDAADRGVKVRVYRFPDERPASSRAAGALAALDAAGAAERFKRGSELMHLKSYCVDGRTLRSGAANFSASGLKRQDNDLVILRGPDACRGFTTAFEAMWKEVR